MSSGPTRLVARSVAIPDPGDLLGFLADPDARVWLREGDGLVAHGTVLRLPVPPGTARTAAARSALAATWADLDIVDDVGCPGSGPVAFASLTFDPYAAGSVLVVPELVLGRADGQAWVTLLAPPEDPRLADPAALLATHAPPVPHDRVRYAGSSLGEVQWLDAVARAVEAIASGHLAKVVLARDRVVWTRGTFDPRLLVRRLTARFPSCYTFAVDGLVGASPELLVGRQGPTVTSRVLAGSARRGAEPAADAAFGQALMSSAKDRAEHAFAADSVRDVLAGVLTSVTSDPDPWLLRLANVQHLATDVRGTLADGGPDALALAGLLHPTAAVCGTPTGRAAALIAEFEPFARGRYAGPVGWIDTRGDGEFAIALRCAEVQQGRARLFAGAGVVAGSLPEAELEETRLKLRAMQSAVEGGQAAGDGEAAGLLT